MKLKKLEITGFKSFVDKTAISFPEGISAVVGPNGCGKSNIIDALKWVMGEQSAKQLRGKAMEDVIFAGAEGKSPLNMAEVSLTLVNDNGSMPEEYRDFSEIMITRRQYRSGERGYFLNKQPCRLKDIHNIFWGSGMGVKSYAVIQQGNIGAITDAGPEELRYFIEEAAGVTRYKNRKIEAMRKVDATQQNLLRVKDIIGEVSRQMNGLQRQVKKAERYKEYQIQVKNHEIYAAFHYFDDFERQIRETASLLAELRRTDDQHAAKLTQLDAAVEKIKLEKSQKSQAIGEQKSQKFELQRKTDKIENDLGHLKKDVEVYTQEIQGLEMARVDLESKNRQIVEEIGQAEIEVADLETRLLDQKAHLERESNESRKFREEVDHLNLTLEGEKKRLMELVTEEARYKNIYQNASNNKESLKRRLKRIDEEELAAGRKVEELELQEKDAQRSLDTIRAEKEESLERIQQLEAQLKEKNAALSQQIRHVQTTENERNKVKSRYTALLKMEENFEWYKDGVKAVMKRWESQAEGESVAVRSQHGILGLVTDIVEPHVGYETAVEAILGEAMQYVLVQDQAVGADAIAYLQDQSAGRSGFIPVSTLKIRGDETGEDHHEAARRGLMNYVDVKEGFESIARALLSRVWVADDLTEALQVWNQSNGSGPQAIVTRNGDTISGFGVMVGGSKDKLTGILAKKQEIKALGTRLADLERELEKARQAQKNLEADARQIETDLQKGIEHKNSVIQEETEAEKSIYKISEDLRHARKHLDIVRLEQEQLLGEESDIDDEMGRLNVAIAENEAEIKATQQAVAETTSAVQEAAQRMERFNQSIMDIKLKITASNARIENSRQTHKRLKQFQADSEARLTQLTEEITFKTDKCTASRERIADCDQKLPLLYEDLKTLEEILKANEADFQDIDAKLQENDTLITTIQSQRQEVLEKRRYLELEQSQRRLKQENITKRIEERYHRTLDAFRGEIREIFKDKDLPIEDVEALLSDLRGKIEKIGDVNLGAINEYEELKQRFEFLENQQADLIKALEDLQQVIKKINRITQERFLQTFEIVNDKLAEVFPRLFQGGSAKLVLTDPNNPLETGVEYMIHPPGKKLTRLSLLSGGEKAMAAIAFIFSIFLNKPAAFCLMDEIDAPLDEGNVYRFNELVKIIGEKSQIVMITHNKRTMEFADMLFGVTMEKKGVSKIVSVDFNRPN